MEGERVVNCDGGAVEFYERSEWGTDPVLVALLDYHLLLPFAVLTNSKSPPQKFRVTFVNMGGGKNYSAGQSCPWGVGEVDSYSRSGVDCNSGIRQV
ncbi:hypothetical protein FNV43_RR18560 [Rhamnella rubrinervis]|uniref:Uncharacterized protein n=1 Tax=Rhamnella rubrinervis TaxID=2594499 RepID=A0A8K0GW88_9ROSA|nr:hypothetical protein FNV43_RR18560 [Rhamnella rubrinervis]